jgi:hypothetical protein
VFAAALVAALAPGDRGTQMDLKQAARVLGVLAFALWAAIAFPIGSTVLFFGIYITAFGPVNNDPSAAKKFKFVDCVTYREIAVREAGVAAAKYRCIEWSDGAKEE